MPVAMPPLLYGTAWKEERTAGLVEQALRAGFRAIDTANQRKHYAEAAVGEGIRASGVAREDLFLQTKFTHLRGQDHRLPYDPAAPIAKQVEQSLESSLAHLAVDRLDSYVLHGPSSARGISDDDREAWRAMEALQRSGRVLRIGVSNVSSAQLAELHAFASVKPEVVQNRTLIYPRADAETRAFCRAHGIAYQGFSLLTAAPALLAHPIVRAASERTRRTPAQVILRFWVEQGIHVLSGTTDPDHMADDVALDGFSLEPAEAAGILRLFG